jgi:uncharacterized protein DUF4406
MKVYLAGPMRGYPELNHPAFHDGAARLRDAGHEVFNPAEQGDGHIRVLLGADLAWITSTAEAVVFLPGWQRSLGALAERATALAIGIPVAELDAFLNGVTK